MKVTVIGSYFRDLVFYTPEFPNPGQTVHSNFATGHGGKGSNQALCAAKLGANVQFISSVGNDGYGDEIRAEYNKRGVKTHFNISDKPTGCAGIFVSGAGQNMICIEEGAVKDLTIDNIKAYLHSDCTDTQLFVFQCELPYENIKAIMKYIKAEFKNSKILLNPAPYRKDYIYEDLGPLIDILVPNETELQGFIPSFTVEQLKTNSVDFQKLGVSTVLVTLGEHGCAVCENGNISTVPAQKVTPVDTTGAGDCWIGAFCAVYTGANISEATKFACDAASMSVQRKGASASCPSIAEVKAFKILE
ncbi:Ribokinase [Spironucleus salmonicida]|uniref:Ribokinase n=1 Tax=Spironucleus salmonicida TaxID=348837 RepID=V6M2P8_9EUKA|nr:Ribokinase [Spironucleus salmonicida]|eukprot:EST47534.1 Ribokinase [Spironucleus salmonicida]